MKKFDLYRQEREKGLTYREIAKKYGVSYQCVAQACGKNTPKYFRVWGASKCIYPNVRKWLNDNKIGLRELLRRMGLQNVTNNYERIKGYLNGKNDPSKHSIDKLLSATGFTYEQFFALDE